MTMSQAPATVAMPSAAGSATIRLSAAHVPAALLPMADVAALLAAVTVSASGWRVGAGYAAAVLATLTAAGLHRPRICMRAGDQTARIIGAALAPLVVFGPLAQAAGWPGLPALAAMSACLLVAGRAGSYATLRATRRHGLFREPTLVVGTGTVSVRIAELLREHPELGLSPSGFLGDGQPPRRLPLPVLGTPSDIAETVARNGIRRVIVGFPSGHGNGAGPWAADTGDLDCEVVSALRASRPFPSDVCVVPRLPELGAAIPRSCLDEVWGVPLVPLRRAGGPLGRLVKRAFDIVAAAALLVLSAPVLAALAAAIRVDSGGPVLVRQARITRSGQIVNILKLRTVAGDHDAATLWKPPADRCTRLGAWLRATHLDELPQLANVLRGQMSLVGPRPERPHYTERFAATVPRYDDRHRVPAGITGWAQVHGLNGDTSIGDRVRLDNQYIEYWSLWLDLAILGRTLRWSLPRAGKRPRPRGDPPLPRRERPQGDGMRRTSCDGAVAHTAVAHTAVVDNALLDNAIVDNALLDNAIVSAAPHRGRHRGEGGRERAAFRLHGRRQ